MKLQAQVVARGPPAAASRAGAGRVMTGRGGPRRGGPAGRDKTGRPTGFLGDQGHHRRRRRPICRKVASLAASEVASAGPAWRVGVCACHVTSGTSSAPPVAWGSFPDGLLRFQHRRQCHVRPDLYLELLQRGQPNIQLLSAPQISLMQAGTANAQCL